MNKAQRQALIASALVFGVHGCVTSKDGPAKAALDIRPAKATGIEAARSDGLYQDAVGAIERRDYALALDMLQAARARAPQDARVLNAFGVVYDKLGRFDLSSRYYNLAKAADPDSRIVAENQAYSARLQGKAPADVAPTAVAQAAPATAMAEAPTRPGAPSPAASVRTAAAEPLRPVRALVPAPAPAKLATTTTGSVASSQPAPRPVATTAPVKLAEATLQPTPASAVPAATRAPVREPAPVKVATAATIGAATPKRSPPAARPVITLTPVKLAVATQRPTPASAVSTAPAPTPKVVATAPAPMPFRSAAAPAPHGVAAAKIVAQAAKPKDARRTAAPAAASSRPTPVKVSLPRAAAARPVPAKPGRAPAAPPRQIARPVRTGSGALLGRPVAVVYSVSQRSEGERLRRQLAGRGWSLSATAQNTRVATRTTIRYEPAHERIAMALARSLAIPVKLERCVRGCSGVTLTLGGPASVRPRRQMAGIGVRQLG